MESVNHKAHSMLVANVTDTSCEDAAVVRITKKQLVTEEARFIFQWIAYGVLLLIISTFGIGTNIINICCFVKQGLGDAVNVSLLGLAISDLGCLITSLGTSIGFNPAIYSSDIPVDTVYLAYMVVGWPHVVFVRLTSWITALITLERCVCMTQPLKVKSIITPKRVKLTIISIFTILSACVAPEFYVNRLAVVFVPERNRTMLTLVFTDNRASVEEVSYAINHVIIPFSAYFTIIICTITLVVTLRKKTKWRQTCTTTVNADNTFKRDQKVAKMVVVISTLFIACFSPLCITFIAMLSVPDLAVDGLYVNTVYILVGMALLLESANSAVNIFVYFHMSSRYKTTFRLLFHRMKMPLDLKQL